MEGVVHSLAQDFAILRGRMGAQADSDAGALTIWDKLAFTDDRLTLAFKSCAQLEAILREVQGKQSVSSEAFTLANRAKQDASYAKSKVFSWRVGFVTKRLGRPSLTLSRRK
jgi:hypothetical protein